MPVRLDRAAAAVALVSAVSAEAAPRANFAVAGGQLAGAVIALGRQGGISIGLDPALGALPVRGVSGTMSIERALSRLLAGLPARAVRIDAATWRIVAAAPHAAATPRVLRALPPVPADTTEIVVTATKRDTRLDRYPGTAYVLAVDALARHGAAGSDAIVERLPALAATALGPGRNKLFIRGIADSSFNGPSQATVGQYLGDLRLNYNAPDPNLTLADIESVEVLEGPQGTLYGAGALGGVVQLVPNPVALDRTEAALSAGYPLTAHAAASIDVSAMLNLPIDEGRLGLRAVAYHSVDGGTINDARRGLTNVNRTVTDGGRIALRFASGGWTVDVLGVVQNIDSADAQYAERGLPPRTRSSNIAQPFDSDYGLAGVTVTREFDDGLSIRSAGGIVLQHVDSVYDFTPDGGTPTLFRQRNRIQVLSNESRIGRRDVDGIGWVAGFAVLHNGERLTRMLGPVANPAQILGVSNTVTSLSGYGESAFRLSPRLTATVGGRLDFAHLTGEVLDRDDVRPDEPRRNELSLLPSLALAWHPRPGATLFARYSQGFRPGNLAVSGSPAGPTVERFRGDTIATAELGGRIDTGRVDLALTGSSAHWEHIQADLVDGNGLPLTANIGTGRVAGLEAQAGWRALDSVRLAASLFVNRSRLTMAAAGFEAAEGSPLPNIAKLGARLAVDFNQRLGRWTLSGSGSLRYVGRSRLGAGPSLAIAQGDYLDTALNARIGNDRIGIDLDASNLLGTTGDRFGLGNPFDVAAGRQFVPLRPRTLRIGVDARF